MAARFVLSPKDLRGCWRFVALSIAACALPALLASLFRSVRVPACAPWGAPAISDACALRHAHRPTFPAVQL